MKNIDRAFVVMLLVLPFMLALVLSLQLIQRSDVAPEDSDARTVEPTATFGVLPVTVTNSPTPTFSAEPVTPTITATPTYQVPDNDPTPTTTANAQNPTTIPTVTATAAAIATSPTSSEPPAVTETALVSLPETDRGNNDQDTTLFGIAVISITVAATAGGIMTISNLLRNPAQ